MSQKAGNEHVETRVVDGVTVEVYGCWDRETPDDVPYEFFDLYVDGDCINLGEPIYEFPRPTDETIRAFLDLKTELES